MIELIAKYNRFTTTAIGYESGPLKKNILQTDPRCAVFFETIDVIVLIFSHFFLLLPYISFEREVAAIPYMTRDYIKMK